MTKKVLIVCQHFVPYSPALGGVARVLSFVDYFHSKGYQVFVLTSDGVDFGYLGYESIVDKAEVIYLSDPFKISMQRTIRGQLDNQKKHANLHSRLLRFVKNIVYELLLPDPGILMRRKYIKAATKLLIENHIENILVSSPPHSMQLVGLSLKKQLGERVNLIVDYRDSWNGSQIFKQKTVLGRFIARALEKQVLKNCDYFSYVSAPMLGKAIDITQLPLEAKAKLVMNGFDDGLLIDNALPQKIKEKKIRVGHFGMINDEAGSYRNIKKLLDVIGCNPQICDNIQFEFYGQAKLSNEYHAEGILFFDNLSYADARKKMLEMDFLLLFHAEGGDSDEVITGKFFEYIASKKPILVISPIDMEARRLVSELKIGLVTDVDSSENIAQTLLSLPSAINREYYAEVDVSDFARSKQNEKLLALLR